MSKPAKTNCTLCNVLLTNDNFIRGKKRGRYLCEEHISLPSINQDRKHKNKPLITNVEEWSDYKYKIHTLTKKKVLQNKISGVYCIFYNKDLYYVGQSTNILYRMYNAHFIKTSNIVKDKVLELFEWSILEETEDNLINSEAYYISKYTPRINEPYSYLTDIQYNEIKQKHNLYNNLTKNPSSFIDYREKYYLIWNQ